MRKIKLTCPLSLPPTALAESGSADYAVPVEVPQSAEAPAAHDAALQRVRAQGLAPLPGELRRRPQEEIQQHVSGTVLVNVVVYASIFNL